MVHRAGADEGAQEGHLLTGGMLGADLTVQAAKFGLGLHEDLDGMSVLPVGGDGAGVGVQQVTHHTVFGFMRGARDGPGPQVHEEHGAPALGDGAASVFDRDAGIADGYFLHDYGAKLERRAAAGRHLVGLDVDDLDVTVHEKFAV